MQARRKNRGPTISLFPFLSVLAVVIGTLTLIITGLSLGEITADVLPKANESARTESGPAKLPPIARELEVRRSLDLARKQVVEKEGELAAAKRREKRVLSFQGSGHGRTPCFVECSEEGLLLDAQADGARRKLVPPDEIGGSEVLASFLQEVKQRDGGLAVFVIRPGGVAAFDRARREMRESGAPCGYMAAPGEGELDYRLYAAR